MSGLNDKQLVNGGLMPLSVKWADPDLQSKKRRAQKDSNAENRMVSGVQAGMLLLYKHYTSVWLLRLCMTQDASK